jgi:hypothetical protein
MRTMMFALLGAVLLAGCNEDRRAPAAPRGLRSVTGDHEVFLAWLANTESDVAGYRIYESDCSRGLGCPYDRIGQTSGTTFTVNSLVNGQTRYFAVAAYDRSGHESDLSYEDVFDTPRPEGFGLTLTSAGTDSAHAGYDFSAFEVVSSSSSRVDIFYTADGSRLVMVAPFVDTEIQDAGTTVTLDDIDFAPVQGWSPTGMVELIVNHAYVVKTRDNQLDHYAKFRVTSLTASHVVIDWAYQVDPGNRELKLRPTGIVGPRLRRAAQPGSTPGGA